MLSQAGRVFAFWKEVLQCDLTDGSKREQRGHLA